MGYNILLMIREPGHCACYHARNIRASERMIFQNQMWMGLWNLVASLSFLLKQVFDFFFDLSEKKKKSAVQTAVQKIETDLLQSRQK